MRQPGNASIQTIKDQRQQDQPGRLRNMTSACFGNGEKSDEDTRSGKKIG
jgi:hypothetical protein